jgi:DNA-binding Lrp family transcriptional regulator
MDRRDVHGELVAALERRGKTRRNGDLIEFCCPRHKDKNPSAWLGEWRWGCHACGFEESLVSLCEEMGVEQPTSAFTLERYAEMKGFAVPKLAKWGLETVEAPNGGQVVAIPYRDTEGNLLRRKFRGHKGTWWEGRNLPTHLYGLDMLAKSPPVMPVVLVEGESDCHAAWHHQTLAIGVPGANSWRSGWAKCLEGREVFVWQEPGEPGEKFVADICRDLPQAKVIHANGTKDLADLHLRGDFDTALPEMMRGAFLFLSPYRELEDQKQKMPRLLQDLLADESLDVEPAWVWDGFMARGEVGLYYGLAKAGKTTFVSQLVACVASGIPFLEHPTFPCPILWIDLEQHPRHTKGMFQGLGLGEMEHGPIYVVTGTRSIEFDLATFVREPEIGLVVIDSLAEYWEIEDECDATQTREALSKVRSLAEDTDAHIAAIAHARKSGGEDGLDIRGSGDIAASVDVAVALKRDPGAENRRFLETISRHTETPRKLVVELPEVGFYKSLGTKVEVKKRETREQLLASITGTHSTYKEIAELSGLSESKVRREVPPMVEDGLLERTGEAKRNSPLRFRRSVPSPQFVSDHSIPGTDIETETLSTISTRSKAKTVVAGCEVPV